MKVCVGTVTRHPEDARIMHRQIRALLDAGHEVTYVAPFTDCNVTPAPELRAIDVPRAVGLHRVRAHRAGVAALRRGARDADLLLVHDLDLLLALPRRRPPTVWDVHEDMAARLDGKTLPRLIRRLEARAERRLHLILAEQSDRFGREHPVVPNHTYVPDALSKPSGDNRIVAIGRLGESRGAADLIEVARLLHPYGIRLDLIGPADPHIRPLLRDAQRSGLLDWFGYVPNRHALRMAEGALAGLSLAHDVPAHRDALPTKVIEYLARGVPVISTPLPRAVAALRGDGIVVPFGDPEAVAQAVLDLKADPARRHALTARGHARARAEFHWPDRAGAFVAHLEAWAGAPSPVAARSSHRAVPA
ncbi:hypothetical protein Aph01nite_03580 [Acrocarpospora phusangensis]|uniref:Glycosyltransferase subfamily 4-like N-terminal domain-containing protein n=1 Tax=Acrocarpospora phusangensis TaxID=1070424 RepID=A0A919Q6V4_9ACTN|nr:glycosyltransferase family 4 protein [Acrocarpospora phusangensis]GIH22048.1 hypothetical protein Aph01nite_03580 [Acrocarpospora phusangensis]